MAKKRKHKVAEERELTATEQLSKLQSYSLRKRFFGAVFFGIILFALYLWQFQSYELQWGRMLWLVCVNIIMIMTDARSSAYGKFIDDHRGGDATEDSIHFYRSGKAKHGGLARLVFRNLTVIALLIILPECLTWHNHRPLFVVTRALQLNKKLFLVLFTFVMLLSWAISYYSQRIYLCQERIKLLKHESGLD